MPQQDILLKLIKEYKFTEAVSQLTINNVNERGNIEFKIYDSHSLQLFSSAANNVNILEALCFMNSILYLVSNSQEQIKNRVAVLKNCIKVAYNKMQDYGDKTIWDGRDDNGNTTAQWLAWGGATEELKDLFSKHSELIEDEKKLLRNVFDLTMEVEHLSVEQKIKLASVLIPLNIQINNINTYNIILQNDEFLRCLKSIINDANNLPSEKFSNFVDNLIIKISILITTLRNQKVEAGIIQNNISKGYEIIDDIFKYQEKIDIKGLLEKDLSTSTSYASSFLHWLLELGNKNLTSLLQNHDENKNLDFYIKDWSGKSYYRSVLEWIANYRFDILKDKILQPYLNPNKKQENEKILINLVNNDSKINSQKLILPFFQKLFEHKPPLFGTNLKDAKLAISNKIYQESLDAENISIEVYENQIQIFDLTSCLISLQQYEKEMTESIGVVNLNLYD